MRLGSLEIPLDMAETRALGSILDPVDPKCCNACATLLLAVQQNALPLPASSFLAEADIDVMRPVEAWGAPDGGYLGVWWPLVSTAEFVRSIQEPDGALGAETRISIVSSFPRPEALRNRPDVAALELDWHDPVVSELAERAWPKGV